MCLDFRKIIIQETILDLHLFFLLLMIQTFIILNSGGGGGEGEKGAVLIHVQCSMHFLFLIAGMTLLCHRHKHHWK